LTSRLLLCEDEAGLRLAIGDRLREEGYAVETAADGDEGLRRALHEPFDLLILDVMMPGRSGFDIVSEVRRQGRQTQVLLLTARGEVVDRVVGLRLGADDYMTKPFAMAELVARVEARLRTRQAPAASAPHEAYAFGAVRVDFRSAEVTREGRPVELSAKEFHLLRHFIEHRGLIRSRDDLLNDVWGYDAMPTTRTVDVHVAGLRKKLEANPRTPQFILTLHGLGYKFVG
jgi:two-component system, OmpR family, alkaline phosphatase synthesis response regulator PhoP